jgi:hypothetical protein
MLLPRHLPPGQLLPGHLLPTDICSPDSCSPRTLAPAVLSFLQLLIRASNNQKPIRKVLNLGTDFSLTRTFTFPSSSPLVLLMLREQVSRKQLSGEQLSVGSKCPGSNCPGSKCPESNCPGSNCRDTIRWYTCSKSCCSTN